MKLTTLTFISLVIISSTTFALSNKYFSVDADQIQDMQTLDGDIVTIDDLKDGFATINNAFLKNNKLFLNQKSSIVDLKLVNGSIINFDSVSVMALIGGDMGGGGSK